MSTEQTESNVAEVVDVEDKYTNEENVVEADQQEVAQKVEVADDTVKQDDSQKEENVETEKVEEPEKVDEVAQEPEKAEENQIMEEPENVEKSQTDEPEKADLHEVVEPEQVEQDEVVEPEKAVEQELVEPKQIEQEKADEKVEQNQPEKPEKVEEAVPEKLEEPQKAEEPIETKEDKELTAVAATEIENSNDKKIEKVKIEEANTELIVSEPMSMISQTDSEKVIEQIGEYANLQIEAKQSNDAESLNEFKSMCVESLSNAEDKEDAQMRKEGEIIDLTVQEAMKVFDSISVNGEYIEEADMQKAMGRMGRYPSKKEVQQMIATCDANGDGTISKDEFIDYCLSRPKDDYSRIRQAFNMFDLNGDGFLDVDEFKRLLMTEGEPLTDAEFAAVMKQVDKNGDGVISIDEFLESMGVTQN